MITELFRLFRLLYYLKTSTLKLFDYCMCNTYKSNYGQVNVCNWWYNLVSSKGKKLSNEFL